MKRSTKRLLIAALISLGAGLLSVSGLIRVPNAAAGVYVLVPVGVILLGLFLITKALEKETTRYDAELRANQIHAEKEREKEIPAEPDRRPTHHHEEAFAQSH
jgi:hypothetical protein